MKRLLLLLLFFLAFYVEHAVAFSFRHYKVEEGLSENTVSCSLQDSKGFMWFGTKDGLSRFDGQQFVNFTYNPADKHSIGNNCILSLYETKNNTLWVGTERGIFQYNFLTSKFRYFDTPTKHGKRIDGVVHHITEDKSGNMWIATSEGLFRHEKVTGKLHVYLHDNKIAGSLSSNNVNTVHCDKRGTIWAGTINGGLNRYNPRTDNFTHFSFIPANGSFNVSILTIEEDTQGDLVMGTITEGIIFFDPLTGKNVQRQLGTNSSPTYYCRDIFEYSPGKYMLATESGLIIYEKTAGIKERIMTLPGRTSSLSDNAVYSISKDREGGIWIGTYFGGVNYISPKPDFFEHYSPRENTNSISGKAVSQFCEDEAGNMWIATEDGGLNCYNLKNRTFRTYNHMPGRNSISYSNVHSLQPDGDNLWVGTFAGGLNLLNTRTGHFTHFTTSRDEHSINDNNVFSIYKDRSGTIWIGTINGLCTYNRAKNNFDNVTSIGKQNFIYDIKEDNLGMMWFATYGQGLICYNPQTGMWKRYMHDPNKPGSLPHNKIISITQDEKHRLWFGTEGGGMCRYIYEENAFVTYDTSCGLPSNVVYMVIPDNNYVWLSTNKGLVRFEPDTKKFRIFTKADGLQGDQFNFKSGYKARDGKIYFGGTNGFNAFYPENLVENRYTPPVVITNMQLFNKNVQISENGSPLKQSITFTDNIVLKHNESYLNFEFVALSYVAPQKNQFAYKLDGFDKDWINAGNERKISYTNLPPGNYVLHIKGSNNDGMWNEEGVKLRIKILRPFWASIGAYIFYLLLLLGAIYYFHLALKRKQLREEKIKLDRMHAENEIELYNAKIDFFTNIAHEIRTPLSLIKAPLDYIVKKQKDKEFEEHLSVMERNTSRLMTLVNQLLDFRKAEKDSYTVSLRDTNINALLQNLFDSFKYSADSRNLAFELIMPDAPQLVKADVECLTKIISNLLSNAIKHANGRVTLSLIVPDVSTGFYEIHVSDDGEGINETEIHKIFQPFYQIRKDRKKNQGTGIGLALVKLLVDVHGGNIKVESTEHEHTTFRLSFPSYSNMSTEAAPDAILPENIILPDVQPVFTKHDRIYSNQELPSLLIVEDNDDLNQFLVSFFRDNYTVMAASDGTQAVNMLEHYSPDLIVSDIMMPDMNGLELCKFIKTNTLYSHIPVVLLTAKTDIKYKIEGLEHGADAYMEKPFAVEHLEAQILNLLENREKLKENFNNSPLASIRSIGKNKADEAFLQELTNIIEANITKEEFSVDELAQAIAMSRSNLYRKLKGLSGLTPNDFIRVVKLKKAVKLMSDGETRINEICFMVGFNTSSYFAKCFKKQFGMLPKDFIKNK